MRLQVGGPCATWFGHLFFTGVYIAATIFFLHMEGRALTAIAINRIVRSRLFWSPASTRIPPYLSVDMPVCHTCLETHDTLSH